MGHALRIEDDREDSVSAAELVRRFGSWQDRVSHGPVFVTHHGRRRLVMLSLPQYRALLADAPREDEGDAALRLATLLDQLPLCAVAFDGRLHIAEANSAACAHLRQQRAELIGQRLGETALDLSRTLAASHIARAAATGEVAAFDAPSLAYPGSWLRFSIFPYGQGVCCLFRPITAEREARRLARSEDAFTAALAAEGTIGHGRLSPRGTMTEVDETLAKLAGFAPESLRQVRLTDILPLPRRMAASAEIEAVLAGGAPRAFDSALLVNQGGERPVRIALAEMMGEHASEGAVLIVRAL